MASIFFILFDDDDDDAAAAALRKCSWFAEETAESGEIEGETL